MRSVCVIALIAGCGFDSPEPSGGGGPFVPLHVPAGGQAPGDGDLTLTQPVDTGALTIGGSQSLPTGVVFDVWPHPGGAELAVLHVRRLRVPADATVRVLGPRALVVIASDEIDIDGVLDGAAHRDQPGPGGAGPAAGMGAGRAGQHTGSFLDSGGSGGGFAAPGGGGGSAGGSSCSTLQGPMGGAAYGAPNLAVLLAGSGGGVAFAASCGIRAPGAGGGAIQLSSATRVRVNGGINGGGGGGGGGRAQSGSTQCNMSAGAGGGSGGAIVLQSPLVEVPGTLAANGGGGGSAGGDFDGNDDPPESDGEDGQDGLLSAAPAAGGRDVGTWSSAGGPGGTTADGGPGASDSGCASNGGGGGGAAGRIVLALPPGLAPSLTGVASPAGVQTTY